MVVVEMVVEVVVEAETVEEEVVGERGGKYLLTARGSTYKSSTWIV